MGHGGRLHEGSSVDENIKQLSEHSDKADEHNTQLQITQIKYVDMLKHSGKHI
jgi:hypothetical protein